MIEDEGEVVGSGRIWVGVRIGLEEAGGEEKMRNKGVLSPNIQKTTDRRRVFDHEFEPSAEVDALTALQPP